MAQLTAVGASALYSAVVTAILVLIIDNTIGFTLKPKDEQVGLDLSQHGEVGMDVGQIEEEMNNVEPKSASTPPTGGSNGGRFAVLIDGANEAEITKAWHVISQPTDKPKPEFVEVIKYLTTVSGTKFKFRGGNPVEVKRLLAKLFEDSLDVSVKTHVEH